MKNKLITILGSLIAIFVVGVFVSAQTVGPGATWFYTRGLLKPITTVTQVLIGGTTTTTSANLEIQGSIGLNGIAISDWSSAGTNYWSDDETNLSPVTSTRGVSVAGLTTDTLNISTITNECLETDAVGNVVGSGSACGSGSGGLTEISSVGDGTSLVADGTNGYVKSITSTNELLTLTDNGDDVSLTMSSSPTFGLINATSGTSTIIQLASTLASIYDLIIGNTLTFISGVINGAVNATGLWTFDILPQSTATPTDDKDLVTKIYVDAFSQGLIVKDSCIVATVASGTLATDFEEGDVVDTYSLVAGDRVLIKDQASSTENGIYVINTTGTPTRATDYDEDAEILAGTFTYIINGGANENTQWVQYEPSPTINVDPLNFRALPDPPDFTASNGIKMVGSDVQINHDSSISGLTTSSDKLAVNYDDSSIGVVAEKLVVKALGITNDMLSGAIDLATKVTGILGISNGGTGATTAQGARTNLLPSQTGNTGKALVTDGSDVSWSTVSGDGASVTSTFGNTKQLDWVKQSLIWTNMPTSTTILFGSTAYYKKMDLTNSYRFRTVRSLSTAGFAGSYIKLQYSTDRVNWYDAGSSEADCSLVGTGSVPCPWASLVTGARTDVWLRYVGVGGDGIVDPRFFDLTTEFTTYASIEQENATTSMNIPFIIPPTYVDWTNIPSARSGTAYIGWGSANYYRTANLYRANKYRIIHRISTTTPEGTNTPVAGTKIDLQCSYNKTSWFNANSGLASPATSTGEVDISVGLNDINSSNWTDVSEACKGAVWLRLVGYGGNGVNDARFNYVAIEFDVDLNADVNYTETDPIWSAVSTTIPYLSANNIFTGTNTFATTTVLGQFLSDGIFSSGGSDYSTEIKTNYLYNAGDIGDIYTGLLGYATSTSGASYSSAGVLGISNYHGIFGIGYIGVGGNGLGADSSGGNFSSIGDGSAGVVSTASGNNSIGLSVSNSNEDEYAIYSSQGKNYFGGDVILQSLALPGGSLLAINSEGLVITTTTPGGLGEETDPIWSAASTTVPYLSANNTFTGGNIFSNATTTNLYVSSSLKMSNGFSIEYDEGFETTVVGNPLGGENIFIRNGANFSTQGSDEDGLLGIANLWLNLDDLTKLGLQGYDVENNVWTFGSFDLTSGFTPNTSTQFNFVGNGEFTGNLTASNLNIANWDTAYGWGNHADAGYLTTETDPLSLHLNQTTPQTISNGAPTFGGGLNISGVGSNLVMKSTGNKISFESSGVEGAYIDLSFDEGQAILGLISDKLFLGSNIGAITVDSDNLILRTGDLIIENQGLSLGAMNVEDSWYWSEAGGIMSFKKYDGESYVPKVEVNNTNFKVWSESLFVDDAVFQGSLNVLGEAIVSRESGLIIGNGETINDYVIKYSGIGGIYTSAMLFNRVVTTTPGITTEEVFYLHDDGIGVARGKSINFGGNNQADTLRFKSSAESLSFQAQPPSSNWVEQILFTKDGLIEQKAIKVNTSDDTSFNSDEWEINLGDVGESVDLVIKAPYLIGNTYSSLPEIITPPKVLAVSDGLYMVDESDRDEFEINGFKKDFSNSIGIIMSLTNRSFEFNGHLLPDAEYYEEEDYLDIGSSTLKWNNLWLRGDAYLGNVTTSCGTLGTDANGAIVCNDMAGMFGSSETARLEARIEELERRLSEQTNILEKIIIKMYDFIIKTLKV